MIFLSGCTGLPSATQHEIEGRKLDHAAKGEGSPLIVFESGLGPTMFILLAGCGVVDSMTEGFKHTQEVASELENAIGEKPFVGFNWSNGSLTNITVTFKGVPEDKGVKDIIELARHSVSRHFKQTPDQLIVAFSVDGDPR
ncbi:MAG: hypothetical protein AB2792_10890 [Candidatus Thiodiazotropha sp.]